MNDTVENEHDTQHSRTDHAEHILCALSSKTQEATVQLSRLHSGVLKLGPTC